MHFCDIFPILWYNFCSAKLLLIWLQGNEIMNLQPKILSNAFLINGYTPAVDMILVSYVYYFYCFSGRHLSAAADFFCFFAPASRFCWLQPSAIPAFTILYCISTVIPLMYSAYNISFKPAAHFLSVCGLFKDFDWYSGKNRTYHEYFPIFLIYHFCHCGCTVTCIGLQFLPRQLRCMAW